jgi:polygalacturonase
MRPIRFRAHAVFLLAVILALFFVAPVMATPALPVININNIVVITNAPYGAKFDNSTDNTLAISNAIVAAAAGGMTNGAAGGTVEIPPGTNAYLCGPIVLLNNVNLQIDAGAILRMLPLGMYPGGTNTGTTFISGSNLHDIEISGSGAIDGQGAPWWPYANTNGAMRAIMISPSDCNRLLIQNVTLSNSPMFHIAISGSKSANSTVQGVTIQAPASSPNTDACDVDGTNILVQNCNISVGDDDFTCGGGTSGVLLTNNTYGNGHGISIGSYTDGGVSNITVINCTMNGTVNGIRIKSDDGRGGLVQNISYSNIGMTNVDFPVQIYAYYLVIGTPSSISPYYASTQVVAAATSLTPVFRNITFNNITATSVHGYPVGIIWARTEMPATNIVFNQFNVTGDRNFCLYNVSGAQFIDSKITVSATSNTFALFNAQVTITNSAPTNTLFTFDGLTTNGYGNSFALYNAQASLKKTNVFDHGPLTIGGSKLTVSNNLVLFPTTTLNYVLGTNAATISVISNLTLGGTINITNGPGFANGTYTLLTYAGNLNGSLPALSGKPPGFNYLYSINTNTPGQVNLLAQTVPSPVFTASFLSTNGGFVFNATNGPPGNSVYVLAATNIALPPAQWTPVATNQFDGNGQLLFTNPSDPAAPQTFYLLELP